MLNQSLLLKHEIYTLIYFTTIFRCSKQNRSRKSHIYQRMDFFSTMALKGQYREMERISDDDHQFLKFLLFLSKIDSKEKNTILFNYETSQKSHSTLTNRYEDIGDTLLTLCTLSEKSY